FQVLFPADAGLRLELNGDSTRSTNDGTQAKRKGKAAGPESSRRMITAHIMSLMQRGFTRLLHEGRQFDLASPDDYGRDDFEDVYVLVDRLIARPDVRQRLVDSLETCFREGHGQAVIEVGTHASGMQTDERAGGVRTDEHVGGVRTETRTL